MITYLTDLPSALIMAATAKKHVLAMFCRNACTQCNQERAVLNGMEAFVLKNFVPFWYNTPYPNVPASDLYWKYCSGLQGSFPVQVILNSSGKVLARTTGLQGLTIEQGYLQGVLTRNPLPV